MAKFLKIQVALVSWLQHATGPRAARPHMNSSCLTQSVSIIDGPAQQSQASHPFSPLLALAATAQGGFREQMPIVANDPPVPIPTQPQHQGTTASSPLLTTTQMAQSVPILDMAKGRGESTCQRRGRHQRFSKWVSQSPWGPPQGWAGSDHLQAAVGGRTLLTVVRFPPKRVWGPNMNVGRKLPNPMEGRTG